MKYITILTLIITMFSCKGKADDKEVLMTCIIYQTGVFWEVYTMDVYRDGTYNIVLGEKEYNTPEGQYINITKRDSLKLNEKDYQSFLNLHDKISQINGFEKEFVKKGGWEVILKIDDKRFNFYTGEQNENAIGETIKKLKEISPIEISLHWR